MVTEKRLIDANELVSLMKYYDEQQRTDMWETSEIEHLLGEISTVQAVEVVHGRWEQARYTEAPLYICSKCGKPEYKQHNYCPNCGANMLGDVNG